MTSEEIIKIMEACQKYEIRQFRYENLLIEKAVFQEIEKETKEKTATYNWIEKLSESERKEALQYIEKQKNKAQKSSEEPQPEPQKVEEIIKALTEPELTSEEILYYAVPYYDELQAQKAEKEKKAQESKGN